MLSETLKVLGLGISVVFTGLISLIGIIYLMSFIVRLVRGEHKKEKLPAAFTEHEAFRPADNTGRLAVPRMTGEKRRETVAAVSAALAEYLGSDISGFRIHSIKRVGGAEELPEEQRRELIAAISAAIAENMGEDVSAIRIHSIKKVA